MADGPDDTLELRYVGARFVGKRLPTSTLHDLPAYRDLISAIARELWLKDHPWRQRVPAGFYQSISFDLTDLQEGSAKPRLEWNRTSAKRYVGQELFSEVELLIPKAVTEAAKLFNTAANGALPLALPGDQVAALNRFGSDLRDEEKIELIGQTDPAGNVIYLDSVRRQRIVSRVKETFTREHVSVGHLTTASTRGWIEVDDPLYGSLSFAMPPEVVRLIYGANLGSAVSYDLMLEFNSNESVRSVREVIDVAITDHLYSAKVRGVMATIGDLRKLKAGWLDGAGLAVSQAAVRSARLVVDQRRDLAELVSVFPTAQGGLTFEFDFDGWDYSIEVLYSGRIELYGVEIDGGGYLESIPFDEVNALMDDLGRRFSL